MRHSDGGLCILLFGVTVAYGTVQYCVIVVYFKAQTAGTPEKPKLLYVSCKCKQRANPKAVTMTVTSAVSYVCCVAYDTQYAGRIFLSCTLLNS
jgi:hypothetical protein